MVLYGEADESLKKRESVLYLANHQSTGEKRDPICLGEVSMIHTVGK